MASDDLRERLAAQYGLPKTATWAEINEHTSELRRKERARALGLPESASWAEINEHTSDLLRKELPGAKSRMFQTTMPAEGERLSLVFR